MSGLGAQYPDYSMNRRTLTQPETLVARYKQNIYGYSLQHFENLLL